MSKMIEGLERRSLLKAVREYEAEGYRVLRQPSTFELPEFLSGLRPDLIAYRDNGNVVV